MNPTSTTLAATGVNPLMVDLVLIIITAGIVGLIFNRLRLAAIPAYLVAGALIGPGLLGLISGAEEVASISQLAIVLLMFGIGLHMDTSEIRGELAPIVGIGAAMCGIVTLVITPGAVLLGESLPGAILVAAAISMSSTAAVMRLLQQRRELRDLHGRVAFGTLIVQDLYAVLALASIPALAAWHKAGATGADGESLAEKIDPLGSLPEVAVAVLGFALIVTIGKWLLPRVLYLAGRDGGTELLLIVGAGAALGSAAATAALGFSPELGAFLAGFLLASTPARHQLIGQLAPVRDLFIPVFFVAVGLGLDLAVAAENWWVILIALPVMLAVKAAAVAVSAWLFGMAGPVAAMAGVILAQSGEFTLVVVGAGSLAGVVSGPTAAIVATVVALSLMLTPTLFQIAPLVARPFVTLKPPPWHRRAVRDLAGHQGASESHSLRAIVAGFGPVGREVANRLEQSGFSCTIIELNPETVKKQRGLGRRVIYGDVANVEILHEAGVETADAILLTMPDHDAMLRACRNIRTLSPTVFVAVRAGYLSRGMQATALGADHVVVDEIATATMMADQVCERLHSPKERDAPVTPEAS